MTNPLHAKYYADQAVSIVAEVLENQRVADETFRMRVHCPELARRITPGQFFMVRIHGLDDPLIGRPFALFDTVGGGSTDQPDAIDFVYLVEGKLTSHLQHMSAGLSVQLWGPLGNGFPSSARKHLVMVAGGIGYTPMLAVAKRHLAEVADAKVTFCYGARTAGRLAGVEDFQAAGVDVRVSTDDGTWGHHGRVTDVLDSVLSAEDAADVHVVCCGPQPMMHAVANLTAEQGVSCDVSLEEPMACGIGICFTCVAKIKLPDGSWDYKRTCVDGPIYDASEVAWD